MVLKNTAIAAMGVAAFLISDGVAADTRTSVDVDAACKSAISAQAHAACAAQVADAHLMPYVFAIQIAGETRIVKINDVMPPQSVSADGVTLSLSVGPTLPDGKYQLTVTMEDNADVDSTFKWYHRPTTVMLKRSDVLKLVTASGKRVSIAARDIR